MARDAAVPIIDIKLCVQAYGLGLQLGLELRFEASQVAQPGVVRVRGGFGRGLYLALHTLVTPAG